MRNKTNSNTIPSNLGGLQWQPVSMRPCDVRDDSGRMLYEGVFRSDPVPRRGRYQVNVFFFAHHPRSAIRKRLAAGECPVDFHKLGLD